MRLRALLGLREIGPALTPAQPGLLARVPLQVLPDPFQALPFGLALIEQRVHGRRGLVAHLCLRGQFVQLVGLGRVHLALVRLEVRGDLLRPALLGRHALNHLRVQVVQRFLSLQALVFGVPPFRCGGSAQRAQDAPLGVVDHVGLLPGPDVADGVRDGGGRRRGARQFALRSQLAGLEVGHVLDGRQARALQTLLERGALPVRHRLCVLADLLVPPLGRIFAEVGRVHPAARFAHGVAVFAELGQHTGLGRHHTVKVFFLFLLLLHALKDGGRALQGLAGFLHLSTRTGEQTRRCDGGLAHTG